MRKVGARGQTGWRWGRRGEHLSGKSGVAVWMAWMIKGDHAGHHEETHTCLRDYWKVVWGMRVWKAWSKK